MTAKLNCVRFIDNAYQACFDKKKYTYSIKKYGSVAEKIANESFRQRKRLFNLIIEEDSCAKMIIWSGKEQKEFTVFIDKDDINKIQKAKWFIEIPTNSRTYYAASDKYGKLHRYILDLSKEDNILVDHINRNGLDDRKENLRTVTNSINKRNSFCRKTNKFHQNGISTEFAYGHLYYRASWMEDDGKVHSKKFSSQKYPNALELAIIVRKQKEEEFNYLH